MSRIVIVTPASPRSRGGNRVTANRWASMLRSNGHSVQVRQTYAAEACDVLVALHARKSAPSIARFARQHPNMPIVLALTGTDLYHDIHSSAKAKRSLDLATRLVMLQPHGRRELPRRLHQKVRVIYQSAVALGKRPLTLTNSFEVCVSGHLRPVKDPFRAAMATRRLPADSRIRVTHLGAALSASMQTRAESEMHSNRRYCWLGDVPRWRARKLQARSRLLVLSSRMEGGANVLSEALADSVPVLATNISGTVGLLGADYPGYFKVGNTDGLAELLRRCEQEKNFYRELRSHCRRRAALVQPAREQNAWRRLIAELAGS